MWRVCARAPASGTDFGAKRTRTFFNVGMQGYVGCPISDPEYLKTLLLKQHMNHPTQPCIPTQLDLDIIVAINPAVRPFVAAILAAGNENPTQDEAIVIRALGLDLLAFHHVAFAGYVRRVANGEDPDTLRVYLEPAQLLGELPEAWAAVAWLNCIGATQRLQSNLKVH